MLLVYWRICLFSVIAILSVLVFAPISKAEYFSWYDRNTGISLTYPDDWHTVHNQKPEDLLTVQAPGERDYASCRVRVRNDKRALIYPSNYDQDIQIAFINFEFWRDYVGEYAGAVLHRVKSRRGFVNSIAGSADYTFISSAGPKTLMRGFAFAGYERGQLYVFECSAEFESYERWHPVFKSILKSANKTMHTPQTPHGHYRAFLSDDRLIIKGETLLDDYE